MTRKRIRLRLGRSEPWLRIDRGGSGGHGGDDVGIVVGVIVVVVLLILIFG